MADQLIVRIDPKLKNKASLQAKSEGKNLSEVVRKLLEDYIKSRDISGYIDNLWDRIGGKIKDKGYTEKDIDSIIREVRKNK